ncbi:Chromosome partition protein Smc [uncultured archaeon]|nr:Chromosome partition protein Smc [uncultured archaeon]
MFIFSLHMHKPSPFYILDEAEASLDKDNARKLSDFVRQMSKNAQFIVVTHSDAILGAADVVLGVTKDENGSRIVGVQLAVGSQFVKKDSVEENSLDPGSIKNVPAAIKEAEKTIVAAAVQEKGGKAAKKDASVSPPAPGQKSDSGLANPAEVMSEAVVKKRKNRNKAE